MAPRLPRPGTTVRWVLTAGVLAILAILGTMHYRDLKTEQGELLAGLVQAQENVAAARAIDLTHYGEQIHDLESRLKNAELRSGNLETEFYSHTHSIDIDEAVFEAAAGTNVTITSIACAAPAFEEIDGIQYQVYKLTVQAKSEVPPQFFNFAFALSEAFPDGTVNSLSMTLPRVAEGGTLQGNTSASLNLSVYYLSQQESSDG